MTLKINDLKVGDVIQSGDYFRKIIDVFPNSVLVSVSWNNNSEDNYKEMSKKEASDLYSEYDLKDYTLVKQEWSWKKLKQNDNYWFLDAYGNLNTSIWTANEYDLFRAKSDNIYQTKKDAQEAYKLIMSKE